MYPKKSFRTFLILWGTQGLSALGSSLTYFTIIFWLTETAFPNTSQKGELTYALMVLSLIQFIPAMFLSPIVGVWIDRLNRRIVMIVADFAQGFIILVVLILLISIQLPIAILFVALVFLSILQLFHSLAFDTSYVFLVEEDQLPRANAMMQTMWTVTGVLAPVLAATLYSIDLFHLTQHLGGIALILGVDALTFIVSGICLLFLRFQSPIQKETTRTPSAWKKDIQVGFNYLKANPAFLWLLVLSFIQTITYTSEILLPVMVKETLSADWLSKGWAYPFAYSFLETVGFIGATVSGVAITWWGGLQKNRIYGVLIPLFLTGVSVTLFGLSKGIYLSAIFLFIRMFLSSVIGSHATTLWQSGVPAEIQGRVFGLRRFVSSVATPLATVIIGTFGAKVEPNMVFVVLGLGLTIVTGIQVFNRNLLRIEETRKLPQK